MSSKVSSGKNHDHSDSKPAGGYAGTGSNTNAKPGSQGSQGSKGSTGAGNQQSGSKGSDAGKTSDSTKSADKE